MCVLSESPGSWVLSCNCSAFRQLQGFFFFLGSSDFLGNIVSSYIYQWGRGWKLNMLFCSLPQPRPQRSKRRLLVSKQMAPFLMSLLNPWYIFQMHHLYCFKVLLYILSTHCIPSLWLMLNTSLEGNLALLLLCGLVIYNHRLGPRTPIYTHLLNKQIVDVLYTYT